MVQAIQPPTSQGNENILEEKVYSDRNLATLSIQYHINNISDFPHSDFLHVVNLPFRDLNTITKRKFQKHLNARHLEQLENDEIPIVTLLSPFKGEKAPIGNSSQEYILPSFALELFSYYIQHHPHKKSLERLMMRKRREMVFLWSKEFGIVVPKKRLSAFYKKIFSD